MHAGVLTACGKMLTSDFPILLFLCLQNAKQGVGGASWSNTWGSHSKVAGAAGEQLHDVSTGTTCKTMEFSYMGSLCKKKSPHFHELHSSCLSLPLFLVLLETVTFHRADLWISQSIQSWSRAQPTRGSAQAALCRNGIQPLPGQVEPQSPQSSSLNWCGLTETKLCKLQSIQLRRVQLRRVWGLW